MNRNCRVTFCPEEENSLPGFLLPGFLPGLPADVFCVRFLLFFLFVGSAYAGGPGPMTAEELGRWGSPYEAWLRYTDIEELRWKLSHHPDEYGFERLSDLLLEAGRHEMAIRAADESLRIDRHHWPSHLNKSTALYRLGEKTMALREAQKARDLAPGRDEPLINMALIRWDEGEYTIARDLFQTVLKRNKLASWKAWVARQLKRLEEEKTEEEAWEK